MQRKAPRTRGLKELWEFVKRSSAHSQTAGKGKRLLRLHKQSITFFSINWSMTRQHDGDPNRKWFSGCLSKKRPSLKSWLLISQPGRESGSQEESLVIKARVLREVESDMPCDLAAATSETSPQSAEQNQGPSKKQRQSLGSFFQKPAAEVNSVSQTEKTEAELNSYLLGQPADAETDPLVW